MKPRGSRSKPVAKSKKAVAPKKPARSVKLKPARRTADPNQGAVVFVLTKNPALARAVSAIVKGVAIDGTFESAVKSIATGARVGLIDAELPSAASAYETLRRLRVRAPIRMALLHPGAKKMEASLLALARFAGAETVLTSPPKAAELTAFLKPRASMALDEGSLVQREQDAARGGSFQDRVLHDLNNPNDPAFLDAVCDPETRLYSSSYAAHAFDMEFKRSQRFALPLSIAIVGFEGEASREVLLELASIFLNEIRDTDMLARFDVNTFFFVMPNTLPEGARVMLERIAVSVAERQLLDIVGDPVELASGVAAATMASNETRESLFTRAQRGCERARSESVAAIIA